MPQSATLFVDVAASECGERYESVRSSDRRNNESVEVVDHGAGKHLAERPRVTGVGVARPVWSVTFERRCCALKFCRECCQFGGPVLGGRNLAGDELSQLVLDRAALATIPRCTQAGDLIEAAAEMFGER